MTAASEGCLHYTLQHTALQSRSQIRSILRFRRIASPNTDPDLNLSLTQPSGLSQGNGQAAPTVCPSFHLHQYLHGFSALTAASMRWHSVHAAVRPYKAKTAVHYLMRHRIPGSELIIACTDSSPRALEQHLSPQAIGSGSFGTEHAHCTAGDVVCCSSGCKGQECVHARALLNKLAAELLSLDSGVELLLQRDHRSSAEVGLPSVSRQNRISLVRVVQTCFDADPDTSVA
jgi:hypothetical protein